MFLGKLIQDLMENLQKEILMDEINLNEAVPGKYLYVYFFSMASKPITIRWIRTGSQSDRKMMYNIEIQTFF